MIVSRGNSKNIAANMNINMKNIRTNNNNQDNF